MQLAACEPFGLRVTALSATGHLNLGHRVAATASSTSQDGGSPGQP